MIQTAEGAAAAYLKRYLNESLESTGSISYEVRRMGGKWLGLGEYVREGMEVFLFEDDRLFFALEEALDAAGEGMPNDALVACVVPVLAYLTMESAAIVWELERLEKERGLGAVLELVANSGRSYGVIWDEGASEAKLLDEAGFQGFSECFFRQLLFAWDLGFVDGENEEESPQESSRSKRVVQMSEALKKIQTPPQAELLEEFYGWLWDIRDELVHAILAVVHFVFSQEGQKLRFHLIK